MLNSIILMGRLTRDPELRKSGNDNSIANFTLAFDNIRVNQDGTRDSSFIDVRVFGATAENVCKHLRKGSKCAITGTIEQRNFLRQDGSKGSKFEVNADSVEFLDPLPEKPVDDAKEAEQAEAEIAEEPEPKFDPFTGKPLNQKAKK